MMDLLTKKPFVGKVSATLCRFWRFFAAHEAVISILKKIFLEIQMALSVRRSLCRIGQLVSGMAATGDSRGIGHRGVPDAPLQ